MGSFINGITDYNEWIQNRKENKVYISKMAIVNYYLAKQERGEKLTFTDYVHLVSCVNISALTGKLEDFYAISTSVLMNKTCQGRARIEGSICKDCYACKGVCRFSALAQSLEINYIILNRFLIPEEAWATLAIPSVNGKSRIESHGDTDSATCARNYLRIIKSHSFLTFGVWTKNINHYRVAFAKENGKPVNMIFIISSIYENVVMEVPEDMVEYVDHVFTVYTLEYAREHGIIINCGLYDENYKPIEHKCRNCMRCYVHGTEFYLNELKK